MLVEKGVPNSVIENLKVGQQFYGDTIVKIRWPLPNARNTKIMTDSGKCYMAHPKIGTYNVFLSLKRSEIKPNPEDVPDNYWNK